MSVRNYHTLNGRIRSETLSGSTTNYAPDALGSTFMTAAASGTPRNYYRFKPYGGFVYQGGPDPDPKFLWTGATGSRVSGAPFAGQYNRARHYGREQAGWTSVDPLWPDEMPYGYVGGNPISWIDPTGLQAVLWAKTDGGCTKAERVYSYRYCKSVGLPYMDCLATDVYICGVHVLHKFDPICGSPTMLSNRLRNIIRILRRALVEGPLCAPLCEGVCNAIPNTKPEFCTGLCDLLCRGTAII